ncbi:GNAT family N-acetyltransferase [Taibaiella chishuiensis]|uniref:RimJ/RimL family protein N-acetyltransferase n=1 Tax=Taibaiella chishuiensis TaxID=1434707 RepID=A0A2P8D885_9BACT|nr:GNAT family N-acetyltransferase [Taibaiella chishuiensis]PSK93434.1 RimJ/RimL family protein N-acetyltransferase [Taibaiella chishuiensis]
MKYPSIQATLKNGLDVTVSRCREEDAPGFIAMVKTYLSDSPCIPMLPEEFAHSIEEQQALIRRFAAQENSLALVARHEGQIVGNIELTGSPRLMMRHTAMVGMGMLRAWRGCGLGTLLLREVINWAVGNPVLEKLWLEVYAENEAGLQLYRRCGFEEMGRSPGFFKRDGIYSDKVLMGRDVAEGRSYL